MSGNGTRTRWKKGQSGNPKGRPRGRNALAAVVKQLLAELVIVKDEHGKERQVTRAELVAAAAIARAQDGDIAAFRIIASEARVEEEKQVEIREEEEFRQWIEAENSLNDKLEALRLTLEKREAAEGEEPDPQDEDIIRDRFRPEKPKP